MPPTTPEVTPAVRNLRTTAVIVVVFALAQAALGGTVLGGSEGLQQIHGYIGYATFVASLVVVFFGWKASKETGHTGTLYHAISLPVLALLQIALAEMGQKWVHVGVGVLFLIAAFGLYAMADRPADRPVDSA